MTSLLAHYLLHLKHVLVIVKIRAGDLYGDIQWVAEGEPLLIAIKIDREYFDLLIKF